MGSQYVCFSQLNTKEVPNASAMYNLIMRLTAAVSIAIASNYLIKFKKQFFSKVSDNYNTETLILRDLAADETNNEFINNLVLLADRESFIMAFNKVSLISDQHHQSQWSLNIILLQSIY